MNMRLLLSGIAAVTGLLGCAGAGPKVAKQPSPECSVVDRKCKLDIVVLDCTKWNGYAVTNANIDVTLPSTIEWTIKTEGYRFRQDIKGIDITGNNGVFDNPQPQGPRKFSWRDKHSEAGVAFQPGAPYYYYINIERDNGTHCARFDPWITNY